MNKLNLTENKIQFLILGVTAIVCSRSLFFFFDDPEGPNLLVVGVVALVLFVSSLAVYLAGSSVTHHKKFWLAVLIQIASVIALYFLGTKF